MRYANSIHFSNLSHLYMLSVISSLTFDSVISQNTSWSHLNTSLESFQSIVDFHGFSDHIYDVVQAFGNKLSETQRFRWSACHIQLKKSCVDQYRQSYLRRAGGLLHAYITSEICYRIRYPERNNRNQGDPFSMRQTGVCEKSLGTQKSTWIIIRPSPEISRALERTIDQAKYLSEYKEDPMIAHLIFLEYQSINWDDYVEHLRVSLEPLVSIS